MHELGIIYQVIRTVDEVKKQQKLSEIESITLQIGEMSDVVPKFVEEAWVAARQTTGYGKTELIVETIPAKARCKKCNHTDLVKNLGLKCPVCSSGDFEIISGREFMIKEITAK